MTDLGASVTARLLNRARASGDDYQILLGAYCFERFLYRLGVSSLRDRFVLKGAMLFRLWSEQPYRDFFDLHYLASHFDFDRKTLTEAVRSTFARRNTPIPEEDPLGLTPAYWDNPSRPAQVRAFARRARLDVPEKPAQSFTRLLHAFLSPVLAELRQGAPREAMWSPGGPWR